MMWRINKLLLLLLVAGEVFFSACNTAKKQETENNKIPATNKGILESNSLSVKNLDSLIRLNPKNDTLFYKRSKLHLQNKNLKDAINDLELAIKVNPDNPDYYIELSNLYILNAQSEKSHKLLEDAAKKFKDNYKIFTELGKLYFLVQDYNKALDNLNKAIDLYPYNANAYYFEAMTYLETKDTAKAKFYFNKAAESNPDFYDAYLMLGAIATAQKDSLAPQYFKAAMRIDTNSIEARFSLAYFYQTVAKDYPQAAEQYEYIINNMDSTYAHAYFNLGYMLLFFSTHPEASIPYFLNTLKYDSSIVDAYVNLGLAYKEKHNLDSTKYFLKKALEVKPNYDRAIKELNKL